MCADVYFSPGKVESEGSMSMYMCLCLWAFNVAISCTLTVGMHRNAYCVFSFCPSDPSFGFYHWIWADLFIHLVHDHGGPVSSDTCMLLWIKW